MQCRPPTSFQTTCKSSSTERNERTSQPERRKSASASPCPDRGWTRKNSWEIRKWSKERGCWWRVPCATSWHSGASHLLPPVPPPSLSPLTPARLIWVVIMVRFELAIDSKRCVCSYMALLFSGACANIERDALKHAAMWWPCFHHVLELVLGGVVQSHWKTGGPTDAIYLRFKKEWPNILKNMPDVLSRAGEKVN